MNKYILILLLMVSISVAGRLVVNGDFEQELTIGWYQAGVTSSADTIDRQTYFDPDPDYEARVRKYNAGYAKLFQTLDIPTTDLEFSVNANLYATATSPYWAAAAVILRYLNDNNDLLGETRIAHKSQYCPWTNTSTIHIIQVAAPNNWYNYSFNINNELLNLPGVNPALVKKIQIALFDTLTSG
ncbi:MAG: hypothetical protein KGZ86_08445 [Candidatus Latescibacteria bacterium]|nr:hypothetical protein [Candidatus Latescibacterota bacterium]